MDDKIGVILSAILFFGGVTLLGIGFALGERAHNRATAVISLAASDF